MKIIKKLLVGLALLIALGSASIYLYLNSLKPDYSANLQLEGLEAPVEVLYDDFAIPHIYAENEADLFYAFGYVHAQDRLFQMEILRRLASGTLAEVFGEAAVPTDKFFRTLNFKAHADIAIEARDSHSPESQGIIAYLKGVNAYLNKGKTPIEFTLAGIPRRDFTPQDVEMIVGYMGYTFEAAFQTEAIVTYIKNEFGETYLPDVVKGWPDLKDQISVDPIGQKRAAKSLAAMADQVRALSLDLPFKPFHGSNGWVISGSKTKSGKPILSNDTHIAFSQPSVWYEAHLECPTLNVYGSFLAGGPFPALGHNEYGGWGITMFENDEADFYKEKLNPDNPNEVWFKNHWETIDRQKEIIKVKDSEDISLEVRKTRHGYLMNGAFTDLDYEAQPIAFQWVYHQLPSKNLEVFYRLSKSKNAKDAAEAVKDLTAPGLNFMWADTEGNIAWWAAGKLPIRPEHVNPNLILDGSTGADEWLGYSDFEYNPQVLNPEKGYLITANNQPADMGNGLVPGYYVPSNRANRIEELLGNDKSDWTEESIRDVINDNTSSIYPVMVDSIKNAVLLNELEPLAKEILAILDDWDGAHKLESIAPTMFNKLLFNIYQNTLYDELGESFFNKFENSHALKRNTKVFFENPDSPWWDDISTDKKENRADIFTKALNETARDLSAQLGSDMNQWQWQTVHTLTHEHPMGKVPALAKYFNVEVGGVPGGRETINNMTFKLDSTGLYKVNAGPALRRVIDFANPTLGFGVIPTGQSGYFMSKHYDDQAELFATGGKRHELTDREMIEKVMIGKSIFKP
jgi:penicillin amidase